MTITLPDLPYPMNALEPQLSEKAVNLHYSKHHAKYVSNLNTLVDGTRYEDWTLDQLVKGTSGRIYNNAAQIVNHTFFWNSMTPDAKPISDFPKVEKLIDKSFGSFDNFRQAFKEDAMAVFGSGWLWLMLDRNNEIVTHATKDAVTLTDHPLLVLDLWEHAYYVDYTFDRAQYVEGFTHMINWKFVNDNL